MNPIEEQRGNYKREGRATIYSGYEGKQSGIQPLSSYNDNPNLKRKKDNDSDSEKDKEKFKDNKDEDRHIAGLSLQCHWTKKIKQKTVLPQKIGPCRRRRNSNETSME